MSDLKERLRRYATNPKGIMLEPILEDAADHIEELEDTLERAHREQSVYFEKAEKLIEELEVAVEWLTASRDCWQRETKILRKSLDNIRREIDG